MAISPDEERQIEAAARRSGVDPSVLAAVVSEGGTLTPAQRDRVRRDRGLDARESRENEIDAMAIELARAAKKAPTPELAVAAFRADSDDPASWDRPTRAFARRVSRRTGAGMQMQAPAGQRSGAGSSVAPAPVGPVAAPEPMQEAIAAAPAQVEAAPPAGEREPVGTVYSSAAEIPEAHPDWVADYRAGSLSPEERATFEQEIRDGAVRMPAGAAPMAPAPAPQAPMGIMDTLADVVTGDSRKTATTEATTDLTLSPQMMQLRGQAIAGSQPAPFNPNASMGERLKEGLVSGLKSAVMAPLEATGIAPLVRAVGVESAPQREQMAMVAANNPNLQVQRDEKGNQSFIDPATGGRFGEDPGISVADIPRAVATIGPGLLPGGAGVTAGRAILGAAGLQAAQEAAQADMGGEFNTSDVLMAGAGEAIAPAARALRGGARVADDAAGAVSPPIVDAADLGDDLRKAAAGNAESRARVVALADVDTEAAKAAAELGVPVPLDVLARGEQVRDIGGLLRAKIGGPEKAAFSEAEQVLAAKADKVLADAGAAFSEGRVAPGETSAKVAASLKAARDDAQSQAKALYDEVDASLKPGQTADFASVRAVIQKRLADVGNNPSRLDEAERRLLEIATDPKTTYQTLKDEKSAIQAAIRSDMAKTPYAGVDRARLRALEAALKSDQLAVAEAVGGVKARDALLSANRMTAIQKELEEKAISAFGRDGNGDLSPLMNRALVQATKDDNKAFRQLMEIVPPEHKREVLSTMLANLTRSRTGNGFAATEFVKNYPALYKNKEIREEIRSTLGSEAEGLLQSLYVVSKKIAGAQAKTPRTGLGLQTLERLEAPGNLFGRVLSSSAGRGVAVGLVSQVPVFGGLLAGALSSFPTRAKGQTLEAVASLFRDEDFIKLGIDTANGTAKPVDIKRMARNPRLRAFLRALKEPHDPTSAEKWLTSGARGATLGGDRAPVKEPKL